MTNSGSAYSRGRVSAEKALQKLKHYCGYQERSQQEVRQKLYSLGLFKTEVEELVARLIEEGYLREERFALSFASGKLRIKGWGKLKLRQGLQQKGISEYNISLALKSLDENEYLSIFNKQANKKWQALRPEKDIFAKKNKWRLYLQQKGFERSLLDQWIFPEENGNAKD